MNNAAENRRRLLDPCHSKVLNITNLHVSRMKLKMKLELRALKKITDDVLQDGANSVVVLPANVYENPLDTVPNQFHDGIPGHYGSATDDQLRAFFGDSIPNSINVNVKEDSPVPEVDNNDFIVSNEEELQPIASNSYSETPIVTYNYNSESCSVDVDDNELQNAIWQICPEAIKDNKVVSSDHVDSNEYRMENADDEGVLFDLS